MRMSKKILVGLTFFAIASYIQPQAECYAESWAKFGKTLVKSFMRQFGRVATEVSVQVLADQLTKQIDGYADEDRADDYVYIQLNWNFYGTPHSGILTLGESGGFLRVAFLNTQLGMIEAVDQNLSLRKQNGLVYLQGGTPRYAGTNKRHPNYLPDTLLLKSDSSGRWWVAAVGDNGGRWLTVYQQRISRKFRNRDPQLFR